MAAPLLFAANYLRLDHSLQRNDGATYLLETQATYLSMKAHGLIVGGFESYLTREFRPIMHSFFAVPFLFLAGGGIHLGTSLYLFFCYSFFVFYAFKLLREYLDGIDLVLATLVISLIPPVTAETLAFNAELSLLAVFTAFLFYLKKSDLFASTRESALCGLFLGLTIGVRPIEGLMYSGLLFIPTFLSAVRNRRARWADLGSFTVVLGTVLAVLCFQQLTEYKTHARNLPYLFLALLPLVAFRLGKNLNLSKNCWWFFGPALAVPILWYGFLIQDLVGWIRWASLSEFAQITGLRNGVSQSQFLSRVADFASWPILASLFVISLLRPIGVLKKSLLPLLFALPSILLPTLLGSFSRNGDPKNYLLSALIACAALLVVALAPKSRLGWLRSGAVGLLALALVAYRITVTYGDWHAGQLSSYLKGPSIRPPRSKEVLQDIYAELARKIPNQDSGNEIKVGILQMRQFNDLDGVIEDSTLTTMSRERGDHLIFKDPYPLIRNTTPEKFDYVRDSFDYIIVFPVEHKPAPIEHFMSDVGEVVLTAWKENKLKQDQLELRGQGFLTSEGGNVGEYLLFRSLRKHP